MNIRYFLLILVFILGGGACSNSSTPKIASNPAVPVSAENQSEELLGYLDSSIQINVAYQANVSKGTTPQTFQFTFPAGVNFQGATYWLGSALTAQLSNPDQYNENDMKQKFKIVTGYNWSGTTYSYTPSLAGNFTLFFGWKVKGKNYLTPLMHITISDPNGYPNDQSPLGTNLAPVTYYSSELVFTDAAKQMMPWISKTAAGWDWNSEVVDQIPVDENGYPLEIPYPVGGVPQIVHTLIYRDIGKHYPSGNYTCLYDGTGDLDFSFAGKVISKQPGKIIVQVTPDEAGINLKITQSSKADRVRNIRLIMPGFEQTYQTQIFYPKFLEDINRYSVIRFMPWANSQGPGVVDWADRTKTFSYTQAGELGVAWEHAFALANLLHTDAWVNIPHNASDDYIRQFAKLAKAQLNPDLKIYLEYSNELWNTFFAQSAYVIAQGMNPNVCPNCDKSNQWKAGHEFTAQRSVQIFDIWKQEFGSNDRLVRVLPSQAANTWVSTNIMDFKVNGIAASAQADVLAIGAYFGLTPDASQADYWLQQGVPGVLQYLENVAIPEANKWTKDSAAAASARGLKLVAYEAGQHVAAVGVAVWNQQLTDLFTAANADPKMYDLYQKALAGWKANGGTLYVHFLSVGEWSQWGSWGCKQYQEDLLANSPKCKSLMDYITQQPSWW